MGGYLDYLDDEDQLIPFNQGGIDEIPAPYDLSDIPELQLSDDADIDYHATMEAEPADIASGTVSASPRELDGTYLADLIKKSSSNIDGTTAELERLHREDDELNNFAEKNWGSVGASFLGAVGGLLAGGKSGEVATAAYNVGSDYYNNLEAQEKQKKAAVARKLTLNEALLKDSVNEVQALNLAGVTATNQDARDVRLGNVPGTIPSVLKTRDQIAIQRAAIEGRDPLINQAVADQINIKLGQPLGTKMRKSDAAAYASATGVGIRQQNADTAGDRADAVSDKATAPVGWKYKAGAGKDPRKVKEAQKIMDEIEPAVAAAKGVKDSIAKHGNAITGEGFTELSSAFSRLNSALATARGAGAAIPQTEVNVRLGDVARMFANGLITNVEAAKAELRGIDFVQASDLLIKSLEDDLNIKVGTKDFERDIQKKDVDPKSRLAELRAKHGKK